MAWIAAIVGRLCLAALFVFAGAGKLSDPAGAAAYLAGAGLPASLAMPAGIFEIAAGLLLALGVMTRLTAIVLAVFVALTTLVFHWQITDPVQGQAALKNLAIFGGLLMVFAYGQVSWRIDTWRERDKRHKAEITAARAEARAEVLERDRAAGEAPFVERRQVDRRRTVADRTDGDPRT